MIRSNRRPKGAKQAKQNDLKGKKIPPNSWDDTPCQKHYRAFVIGARILNSSDNKKMIENSQFMEFNDFLHRIQAKIKITKEVAKSIYCLFKQDPEFLDYFN